MRSVSRWCFRNDYLVSAVIGATILAGGGSDGRAAPTLAPEGAPPSLSGATGLVRVSTAEPDDGRGLQFAVFAELSRSTSFLVFGDTDTRAVLHLSVAMAPIKNLEIFAALWGSTNEEQDASSRESTEQASSGAVLVGAKPTWRLGTLLAAGGEGGVELPSRVSSLPAGASAWLKGLCSLDLSDRFRVPVQAHLNVGYYFDNSWNRYDFNGLSAAAREIVMFADGVAGSGFRAAVGIEAVAYERSGRVKITPFGEYHFAVVLFPLGGVYVDQSPSNPYQQWLTVGTRARLGQRLTLSASVDVALQSVGFSYGPPLPPFNIVAGVSLPIGW
jgi:hypothetical protein